MYDFLAGITDVNIKESDQLYCAGTEIVRDRVCVVFLLPLSGALISKKLWVGIEDGLVYRIYDNGMTCDFSDIKINTGLDKNFLGGSLVSTNVPVISQKELNGLWHKNEKSTK